MFKRFIFLFLLIILLSSCTHELNKRESYVTKKEKELNLKNIELEKKEKELSQKEKELNVKLLKINKKEKEIEKKDNSKKKEEKILVEKQEEMDKLKADIAKSLWVKDSKKVLEIFKPLVKYFKNKNDTNIQEKEKKDCLMLS